MTPMEQPERPRQQGNVRHLETQLRARVQMMIAWEARREEREIVKRRLKARRSRSACQAPAQSPNTQTSTCAAMRPNSSRRPRPPARCRSYPPKTFSRAGVDPTAKSLNETQVQNGEPK